MAEREKKPKVTKGKVTVKKKTLKERFFKNLIDEDAGTISDYIIDGIVIPAIMNTIHNIITGTADKIFGGGSSPSNAVTVKKPNGMYTAYNKVGTKPEPTSNKYDFKQFVFADRLDAETVKDQLVAAIEGPYGKASVADFYDLIGKETDFTDNNYGWDGSDIKQMSVIYTNNGYVLKLPKPGPLR